MSIPFTFSLIARSFACLTFASVQFEKVLVLGLRERSDKRDAIVLSSSVTGFEVEFVDAVKGDEVSDKARPAVWLYILIA